MRLVNAERSCGITVQGVGACSCSIATDAMWARVWPTRRSASLSAPGRAPNKPSGPHRNGVHGGEAGVLRGRDKPRPSVGFGLQVGDGDGLAGGIAVHTRT